MSEAKSAPKPDAQVDLVLANTVSRLNCSISEAREFLARQSAVAAPSPAKAPPTPISKSDESLL